jgi:hypothetical protein
MGADADAALTCSPDAAAGFESQAAAALQQMFTGTAPICAPGATGGNVSVCTTAACNSMANTCAITFASSAFSFDPTNSSFTVTTDVTAIGGGSYTSINCTDMTLTSKATKITGTLQMTIMGDQVTYTPTNVVATPGTMGLSGCGAFSSVASLFLGAVAAPLATTLEKTIEAQSFTYMCQ